VAGRLMDVAVRDADRGLGHLPGDAALLHALQQSHCL
jgi:hypothetical protein